MAILTDEQKRVIASKFAHLAYQTDIADLDITEILAAIQPTEDWIENSQTSFNNALPNPFKNTATLQQKTVLFCYVAMRRAGLI